MDMKEQLYKDLPKEAVKQHPTKTYLSSIKAIYVTDRFNEVFGIGKWTIKVQTEHVNHETGMVITKVIFEVPSESIYYESYGGNDNGGVNNKNFDLGDAYKGACTDAITKIGSYLGVGISVFRGLNDNVTAANDDKKWLNTHSKEWTNAMSKKTTLKEVMQHYKVSKKNQEIYTNELNTK